jgi:hypothetical protein
MSTSPLERILGRLPDAKQTGRGWKARCPAHADRTASLAVDEGVDGRILVKCFAGCETPAIVGALGLKITDLFPTPSRIGHPSGSNGGRGAATTPGIHDATTQRGCTLTAYAAAKCLPIGFLRGLDLADVSYLGRPAVRIPYVDLAGSQIATRFRLALTKGTDGDNRFAWKRGDKPQPYGLARLADAREAGHIVLDEGESDTQTLWFNKYPALGIPGADSWRKEWAKYLDGIALIYVVIEPDAGGAAVRRWLASSSIRDRARLVDLGDFKDPSGLYLDDPARFRERFDASLAAAVPFEDAERAVAKSAGAAAWNVCQEVAESKSLLDRFADTLAKTGVVGERTTAKLLFLVFLSRLLDRPLSAVVKGPSSAGKSFLVERVSRFFPPSAYYALSAMSERALAYSTEPLAHRILVIYEAAGLMGDFASYLARSLLSEGRVRYETVEKTRDGLKPRLIEREGPTGLIVTTTRVSLHPENETRMLSLTVSDSTEQTAAILERLGDETDAVAIDLSAWHALQVWLESGERRVTIPFARDLTDRIPPVATRLRRDIPALLTMIRAHALLHRATRDRTVDGRIVATLEDYALVRELLASPIAVAVGATVTDEIRATVQAVATICTNETFAKSGVNYAALGRALKLDRSTALRRAEVALERGYLRNLEDKPKKPARLVVGDPLPDDVDILPAVNVLRGCAAKREMTPIPPPLANDDHERFTL